MRKVIFYIKKTGEKPVETFLDTLSDKAAEKILWVLKILEELHPIPGQYYKKLDKDIWECRIKSGSNIYRLFGFFKGNDIILTHGMVKKTDKIPREEIERAEKMIEEYFSR
ncbi:MAG: type II toxin-antitoxin system RelE/ParE family toxin [Candidatus Omnitrophica bacterium]|nr:type II toxin-antitoxin system RelE/ParE family toxin [Candidatus Omnitrophota bacterium]